MGKQEMGVPSGNLLSCFASSRKGVSTKGFDQAQRLPSNLAKRRRDTAIKAAQDRAWNERARILRELQIEIDAIEAEYERDMQLGLAKVMAG